MFKIVDLFITRHDWTTNFSGLEPLINETIENYKKEGYVLHNMQIFAPTSFPVKSSVYDTYNNKDIEYTENCEQDGKVLMIFKQSPLAGALNG
jgi:hypothetical protein